MAAEPRIRRALLSVSDKDGIEGFARSLHGLGVELVSTGGTARLLSGAGLPVTEVSALTGFPEIMDGRVKTLHPLVHGALLGRRGADDRVMRERGIEPIDLLAVNLYPFERTVARPDCRFGEAVENIDVGGPAMLRAAAKNHAAVAAVSDRSDYPRVIEEMRRRSGALSAETRFALAAKAFAHTARYDAAVADYLGSVVDPGRHPVERRLFPAVRTRQLVRQAELRYGENPHQAAALYRDGDAPAAGPSAAGARLAQGKPLSFNNVADADAAFECVRALGGRAACVIVKHANPCGAAVARTGVEAYERARGFLRGTGTGDRDVWPGAWSFEKNHRVGFNARLGYVPAGLDFLGAGRSVYLLSGVHWLDTTFHAAYDNGAGIAGNRRKDRGTVPWLIGAGLEFGSVLNRFDLRFQYTGYDVDFQTGDGQALHRPQLEYDFDVDEWGISLGYTRAFGFGAGG